MPSFGGEKIYHYPSVSPLVKGRIVIHPNLPLVRGRNQIPSLPRRGTGRLSVGFIKSRNVFAKGGLFGTSFIPPLCTLWCLVLAVDQDRQAPDACYFLLAFVIAWNVHSLFVFSAAYKAFDLHLIPPVRLIRQRSSAGPDCASSNQKISILH